MDEPIINELLISGLKLKTQPHLDGGGALFFPSLHTAILESGKTNYEHGLEWCSGAGRMGFELLGLKISNHFTFMDAYATAIERVKETVKANRLTDQVDSFVTDSIANIGISYKWDLVIGNPPHSFNLQETLESLVGKPLDEVTNTCRILVDDQMKTHWDFFNHIRPMLTDDADLFIIEHDISKDYDFRKMGELNSLEVIATYPCLWGEKDMGHQIYHYKAA